MSSIDTNRFRDLLLAERKRIAAALENLKNENPGTVEEETGEESSDQHLADTATAMHDRELDYGLTENEEDLLTSIDAALQRIEDGTYGICTNRGEPIGEERLEAAVGRSLHRLREAAMSEPAPRPTVDVRVGSSTDGLAPVSVAERSMAAGAHEWIGLGAVAGAAVIADQVTKRIVAGTLDLAESRHVAGPLNLHHVQNSGIAFGLFPEATTIVIALTAMVIAWLLVVFARSGARHPVMAVGLGLVVGGSVSNLADRIRLGHVTDFIDLEFWPAFNLADTFIVVGVALLLGAAVISDRPHPRHR